MSIVMSETIHKGVQANGYRVIQHRYTDHLGTVHMLPTKYVAPDFDDNADRLLRVSRIEAQLAENELQNTLVLAKNGLDTVDDSHDHQTKQELISAIIRQLWLIDVCDASNYKGILVRLAGLTDAQLASVTGASASQVRAWIDDLISIAALRAKYD